MTALKACWCGNPQQLPFCKDYSLCSACGTLVSQAGLTAEQISVQNDSKDFYGKEYWFSHQTEHYGFPDIRQRARQDLPERCLHWLQTLLRYKLPPAKVLELGSAHGGFVALARWSGFDAVGLELSPWVVEFARQSFDIPMLLGSVETQQIPQNSLDAIVLYDVLEHLPDPLATLTYCISLLKEDGIFVVQMPNYPEEKSHAELVAEQHPFLQMLTAVEHLYLFTRHSAQFLFEKLGFNVIQFESPLFATDMFLVASRQPLTVHATEAIDEHLLQCPSGRLIRALLDGKELQMQLQTRLQAVEADRGEAFAIAQRFGSDIQVLNQEVQKRQAQLDDSQTQLYDTQRKLAEEQNCHQQTQSHLATTQARLSAAQTAIDQLQQNLQYTQAQLLQTQKELQHQHTRFQRARDRIQKQKAKIAALQSELSIHQSEIAAIKTSKFWKLRSVWFQFKRRLGLPTD